MQNPSMFDLGLFTGAEQHENFANWNQLLLSKKMLPADAPYTFPKGADKVMPKHYTYEGAEKSFEQFFIETDTAALLVLQDGQIQFERYALTGGKEVPWVSMSVAKSFISTLVGIAIEEGHIQSIEDTMDKYIPDLSGSAYDGVTIKDVLQMSSGASWNEDYSDPTCDVFRLGAAVSGVSDLNTFVTTTKREFPAGQLCRYNSTDTQALGSLLACATQKSVSEYMQEKLCTPLGMEYPSYWMTDHSGMEGVFAGLSMTARDFAKLGELFRNKGNWKGQQIISADWVERATRWDAPHLEPGKVEVGGKKWTVGYGYQWWIPDGDRGAFTGIGVYNQFVYVDPISKVTIVKLSANRQYGTSPYESTNKEIETIEFLRRIVGMF